MKSLPGTGVTCSQSRLARIVRREQQQQLRLQRIGVLELVDEDAREALLEVPPHLAVVANQVARAEQQVEEVERAFARLERARSASTHAQQLAVQQRGEVGVGAQPGTSSSATQQRVARVEDLRARDALAVGRRRCPCARA